MKEKKLLRKKVRVRVRAKVRVKVKVKFQIIQRRSSMEKKSRKIN